MYGIVFINYNGFQEMAFRKLFSSKDAAEAAKLKLTAQFGPLLQSRYAVVEMKFI